MSVEIVWNRDMYKLRYN